MSFSLTSTLATVAAAFALSACSPKFDWRDYRSSDAPYAVQFPGKPSSHSRSIKLDQLDVDMTMTATEVDGVTFAVGSALLADPAQAQAALLSMKTALVKNIGGTVIKDQAAAVSSANAAGATQQTTVEVEARGAQHGEPVLLIGHFVAKDKRIYQVIVIGREKQLVRDTVDTFLSSFKLN
ncbi:hypothetical protein HSX11_24725 [Oxalobacteraceae bacterium]|nr:hypothetical protein [Oxalobacteraceae bacterium]